MRITALVLIALSLSFSFNARSLAETAVAPAAFANMEGNRKSGNNWSDVARGMNIYDSSVFDAVPDGPIRITSFNLRPDGAQLVGDQFGFDNLKLLFAVTPVAPADMSPVFETNVANASTEPIAVYDQQVLIEVINPDPRGSDTRPFDYKMPLAHPFEFDPKDGNLLVEWVFGNRIPEQSSFDTSDEVYPDHSSYFAFGANPTAGVNVFSVVTQFEFEAVPEPATVGLLAIGSAAMLVCRRLS